ncbi:5-formyltetrahydrofolate cyclo-ligase [Pelagibacterales bacterium SAG-MED01]|nr:5-formyltetrahydrofolate cyclo-ligase [Pelagibacterales bacterium SAG-MED01]
MNKSQIRKKILKLRKQNNFKKLKIDFKHILKILKKNKITGKFVGGYYPYNYEVDAINILNIFEKQKYHISLPKIKKKSQMDFFSWSIKDPLTINKYGIPEPVSNKIIYPSILLVPLVAFDKNLNRIGYGGGFYDRYIKKRKKNNKIITIGLAYSFQKVREIPINKYDIKLDFIVTDKES